MIKPNHFLNAHGVWQCNSTKHVITRQHHDGPLEEYGRSGFVLDREGKFVKLSRPTRGTWIET